MTSTFAYAPRAYWRAVEELTLEHRTRLALEHATRSRRSWWGRIFEPSGEGKPLLDLTHEDRMRALERALFTGGRIVRGTDASTPPARLAGVLYDELGDWTARDLTAPRSAGLVDDDALAHQPVDVVAAELVDPLNQLERSAKWHNHRSRGHAKRFDTLRSCGSATAVITCANCARPPVEKPVGCDVVRLCSRCATVAAIERRQRFGRARALANIAVHKAGGFIRARRGGRYTEKMLTLTVPHAGDGGPGSIGPRIATLYEAWPIFLARLNAYFRRHGEDLVSHVRCFEWTLASDHGGHPHFHIYLLSPFLPDGKRRDPKTGETIDGVRQWWAAALEKVGAKVDRFSDNHPDAGEPILSVDVRQVDGDPRFAYEIIKGGKRDALAWSKLNVRGLADPVAYAGGWCAADAVPEGSDPRLLASLYIALEAKRLIQGSRGLFGEVPPSCCPECGAIAWRIAFLSPLAASLSSPSPKPDPKGTSPPCAHPSLN